LATTDGDTLIGPVTDHGDGTYTATLTASATADREHIHAYVYFYPPGPNDAYATLEESSVVPGSCLYGPRSQPGRWSDLDPSFGPCSNGEVLTSLSDKADGGWDVAVQHIDGPEKIVVATEVGLLRYNDDGSPDATFAKGALPGVDLISVQPDGKILGRVGQKLWRANADGTTDNAFGQGGVADVPLSISGIAVQPDGKLLVAGSTGINANLEDPLFLAIQTASQPPGSLQVARLNVDGSPDTQFGTNGVAGVRYPNEGALAYSVAVEPGGRIVVAGLRGSCPTPSPYSCNSDFALARFLPNGAADPSFIPCSPNAVQVCQPTPIFRPPDQLAGATNVMIQPDGKIVAGGFVVKVVAGKDNVVQGKQSYGVARFNADDGSPDTAFNPCTRVPQQPCGGTAQTPPFPGWEPRGNVSVGDPDWGWPRDMAIQPDGKIVLTGYSPANYSDFLTARFKADGTFENCSMPEFVRTRIGDNRAGVCDRNRAGRKDRRRRQVLRSEQEQFRPGPRSLRGRDRARPSARAVRRPEHRRRQARQ
jgi:uncharacterized delta-60 repeat protein